MDDVHLRGAVAATCAPGASLCTVARTMLTVALSIEELVGALGSTSMRLVPD